MSSSLTIRKQDIIQSWKPALKDLASIEIAKKMRFLRINVLGLKINAGNSNCGSPMICHYFLSGQKRFTAVQSGKRYFILRIKHILGPVSTLSCGKIPAGVSGTTGLSWTRFWTRDILHQKLDSATCHVILIFGHNKGVKVNRITKELLNLFLRFFIG